MFLASEFVVLLVMEVLLGIDNIIFIDIAVSRVRNARLVKLVGLSLAVLMRIIVLLLADFLISLDQIMIWRSFSVKESILLFGGLFLVFNGLIELKSYFVSWENANKGKVPDIKESNSQWKVVLQIVSVDLVFSVDSVTAALAITRNMDVIIYAFITTGIVVFFMLDFLGKFLSSNPMFKVAAIAFIVAVGVKLCAESFELLDPYVFYSLAAVWMLLSVFVLKMRSKGAFKLRKAS